MLGNWPIWLLKVDSRLFFSQRPWSEAVGFQDHCWARWFYCNSTFFFSLEQTFQFLVNFWKKLILKIPPVFSLLLWSSRLLNSAILEVLLTKVARILVWVCFYVTYYYSFWETSWCLLSPLEWTSDKKLVAKIRHCAISKSE